MYQIINGCQSRNINWNRELTAKCINRWQMHRNHLVKHIFYEPSSIIFYALLFFFSFCISFCIFFFTFLLLTFFFNSLLGILLVITELMPLSGHNYLTVNLAVFKRITKKYGWPIAYRIFPNRCVHYIVFFSSWLV